MLSLKNVTEIKEAVEYRIHAFQALFPSRVNLRFSDIFSGIEV